MFHRDRSVLQIGCQLLLMMGGGNGVTFMTRWRLEISLDFYEFTRLNKESSRSLRTFKFFKLSQTGLDSDLLRIEYFRQQYITHFSYFFRRYTYPHIHFISYNTIEI